MCRLPFLYAAEIVPFLFSASSRAMNSPSPVELRAFSGMQTRPQTLQTNVSLHV